MKIQMDICFCC